MYFLDSHEDSLCSFLITPIALAFHGVANTNGHIGQGDRDRSATNSNPNQNNTNSNKPAFSGLAFQGAIKRPINHTPVAFQGAGVGAGHGALPWALCWRCACAAAHVVLPPPAAAFGGVAPILAPSPLPNWPKSNTLHGIHTGFAQVNWVLYC